jgi:hypothetical protein
MGIFRVYVSIMRVFCLLYLVTIDIGLFAVISSLVCKKIHLRLVAGFPPRRPGFKPRVWSSGICGGQSGVGAGFLRVRRFPLTFIPPNSLSSQSPGAGTIGQ